MLALAGCANLNSIHRTLELGGTAHGFAVDVKQRAIFSVPRTVFDPANRDRQAETAVVCPEPSPDALSAYVLSGGLTGSFSGTAPTASPVPSGQVQAAATSGENSASIGLRTQSIQLLRDGLFSNCIAYMNGAVQPEEFYLLQRRSQNFTLGLLAIEQLTGATKAEQAAISTGGTAATGSDNTDKESAALDSAKTAQNEAKTAHQRGLLEVKKARTASEEQRHKVNDARKTYIELKATKNPDEATKTMIAEAEQALNSEKESLVAKQNEVESLQIDVDSLKRTLDSADDQVTGAQDNLAFAKRQVRASVSGRASLSESGGQPVKVTDKVASAVVQIVREVLKESGRGEGCYALIDHWVQMSLKDPSARLPDGLNQLCGPTDITAKAITLEKRGLRMNAEKLLKSIQ